MIKSQQILDKFWDLVDVRGEGECWPWLGSRNPLYGQFYLPGKVKVLAHVFSLEIKLDRDLEEDEQALHTCDNPPCCNPSHLFSGNQQSNIDDMALKGRGCFFGNATLGFTQEAVLHIIESRLSYTELSSMYEVSRSTIYRIKNRQHNSVRT